MIGMARALRAQRKSGKTKFMDDKGKEKGGVEEGESGDDICRNGNSGPSELSCQSIYFFPREIGGNGIGS